MSLVNYLKDFLIQCKRVWVVTKKPSNTEFKMIAKASAIGILALGFVGFAIFAIIKFLS